MKYGILVDNLGNIWGVLKGDPLHNANPTYSIVEVDQTSGEFAAQAPGNLYYDGHKILQVKDKRNLWNFLKAKGQEMDYQDFISIDYFDEYIIQTKINETREVKSGLTWNVPEPDDFKVLLKEKTLSQVSELMDSGLLVLKWRDKCLGFKAGDTLIKIDKEREDWFWDENFISIIEPNNIYKVGDIEIKVDSNVQWVKNYLSSSSWNRKNLGLNSIDQWIELDGATVIQFFKNNIPFHCKLVRHSSGTTCTRTVPTSLHHRSSLTDKSDIIIAEDLFYQWLKDAGYVTTNMYMEKEQWNKLFIWASQSTKTENNYTIIEDTGTVVKISSNIDIMKEKIRELGVEEGIQF